MSELQAASPVQEIDLAFPLDMFYGRAGLQVPKFERIAGIDMPQPYRHLLVGEHDMTPTLEAFHCQQIGIRVLDRAVTGGHYSRLVVLVTPDDTPVEFGAIVIYLERLPEDGREKVLEGRTPLGTVLAQFNVIHSSCPQAFVKVAPDSLMKQTLKLVDDRPLYGRRNVLLTADHQVLADILEILPPSPDRG